MQYVRARLSPSRGDENIVTSTQKFTSKSLAKASSTAQARKWWCDVRRNEHFIYLGAWTPHICSGPLATPTLQTSLRTPYIYKNLAHTFLWWLHCVDLVLHDLPKLVPLQSLNQALFQQANYTKEVVPGKPRLLHMKVGSVKSICIIWTHSGLIYTKGALPLVTQRWQHPATTEISNMNLWAWRTRQLKTCGKDGPSSPHDEREFPELTWKL